MRLEELVELLVPGARVRFKWSDSTPVQFIVLEGRIVGRHGAYVLIDGPGRAFDPPIDWILDVLPANDSPEALEKWLARSPARLDKLTARSGLLAADFKSL